MIGEKIKEIRKDNKITQKQLAILIGKTDRTIQKYESGEITPSIDVLTKIATIFDTSAYTLLGSEEKELQQSVTTDKLTWEEIPTKYNSIIGSKIKYIRKNKGLTLKDLGKKVDLSEQAIGQYERGERKPSIEILTEIADALETSIYNLIGSEKKDVQKSGIINKLTWGELPTETQEYNSTIGNNIALYRNKLGLTQKELAEKSGITRESIGNYERGDRIPQADVLNEIAKVLQTSVNNLINGEDTQTISTIGENIKIYRTNRGLTQKQLAEKCLLSESAIKSYESSIRKPKIEALNKIADVLGVSLNYLTNSNEKTNCIIKEKDITLFTTDELLAEIKRRIEL